MSPRSSHVFRQVLILLLGLILTVAGLVAVASTARAATDPCGTGGNAIACENSKPGSDPDEWELPWAGAGDESIQGFATDMSVDAGSPVSFKIDTPASNYTVTIYRIGYYGGDGARKIADVPVSAQLPQRQPNCMTDEATELYDCGNWAVSATWAVPSTAVSGVYIAKLEIPATGARSHIIFVVRNDASHSDVVFQTSDPTWQAYNPYGGSDFYQGAANGRAYKVSYNRPIATRSGVGGRDFFFANEYPAVRFLERNGYDISYISGVDTDRAGALLKNHHVFLSVGHDEYWSAGQRANVEAARDAGVNLQFLSGNEVYWKTRYEPSTDATHTPYRTLASYKETWSNGKVDPSDEWTGTWRDPRFAPTSKGAGRPENALTGTEYMSNFTDLPVTVSAEEGKLRLWRGTPLASMTSGSTALAPHTIGYESNEDVINSTRPGGLIRLSTTTGAVPEYLQDYGNTTAPGSTTHHLTLYKAANGALVFSAGSVQWSWGLDVEHDTPFAAVAADARMQQAQVNLLADMGAQPATLMTGLVKASASADTAAPTVSITSPAAGSTQPNGAQVTLSGGALDAGGGRVAGVEVSTDGGSTWQPATGTTSWSFSYMQHGSGSTPVQARAIDDSANVGPAASRSFAVTCPCTAFGNTEPPTPAADDGGAVELGLRFTTTSDGFVSGVRFYKGMGNDGPHTGTLWSASGEQLATVAFSGESATGWQTAGFATAVPVASGETYVVSYSAPNGHYAVRPSAFGAEPVKADPFLIAGGFGADPAGVFGGIGSFPTASYMNSNYFVDAVYTATDTSPLTATQQWPTAGSSSVTRTTTISARFSKPVVSSSVGVTVKDSNDAVVTGTTTYDPATRVATFTPSATLAGYVSFTVLLTGSDTSGNNVSAGKSWSFRTAKPPAAPGVCPCTLFDEDTLPTILQDPEKTQLTLGVRFSATTAGTVSGVSFYKGVANVGPHTGTVWSANGTALATGTFENETTSGWQTLVFDQPVAIQANTTYVASYSTNGNYSATANAFGASDLSRGPLRVSSSSGAYLYGNGFPTGSSPSSYLVDVVFEKGTPTLAVTGQDPAPGAVSVPRSTLITTTFSAPLTSGYAMAVSADGAAVTGTGTLGAGGTTLIFTPGSPLPADAAVTVTLTGLRSQEGVALADQTWTFTTRSAESQGDQTLFGDQLPSITSADDAAPVEVGTAFSPRKDGRITAIRFYKGTGNNGTHVGSLWSATGDLLARATFVGETGTGWQQANLPTPVDVHAGASYTVSYLAPQGHYAASGGFFSDVWTAGDLTIHAGGGRYLYGAGGGFPVYTSSANYFADVAFEPTAQVSLFGTEQPTSPSVSDGDAVELGTAFSSSTNGTVTALRFYKGPGNDGVHVGSLWSATGTRLASVTFTNESESGWQRAVLSTPVPITAGQTYVVSYLAPHGHYSVTGGYFAAPKTVGPLTAPAASNGRFFYGPAGGFPTSSYNSTNYYADIDFMPAS